MCKIMAFMVNVRGLGLSFCTKMCKIMAFMVTVRGLGLSFCIFRGLGRA